MRAITLDKNLPMSAAKPTLTTTHGTDFSAALIATMFILPFEVSDSLIFLRTVLAHHRLAACRT